MIPDEKISAAEAGLVGSFLDAVPDSIKLYRHYIKSNILRPEHFTDAQARAAFVAILNDKSDDCAFLQDDVRRATSQEFVELAISNMCDVPTSVLGRVKRIAREGRAHEKLALLGNWQKDLAGAPIDKHDEIQRRYQGEMRKLDKEQRDADGGRKKSSISLNEFAPPTEEERAALNLLGNGWMRKGQAAMLVAFSGAGKSTMSVQMAYAWAMGRPVFGINPQRPLKVGIYQTEDDDVEIAEMIASMDIGAKECWGATDEEIVAAKSNIRLFRNCKERNAAFVERMREDLAEELENTGKPLELIIVNPLHSFAGVNISDNTEMSNFLRDSETGIDSVIKDEDLKCGLLAIHHTGKPPSPNQNPQYGLDDMAQYVGFGASELPNYMRAVLLLKPRTGKDATPLDYLLVAAKRQSRLEWEIESTLSKRLPAKMISQSPRSMGIAFWLEKKVENAASAPATPAKTSLDANVAALVEHLRKTPETLTDTREWIIKHAGTQKRGNAAYGKVTANPEHFGLAIAKTGRSPRESVIGTPESLKKWRELYATG